MTKVPLRVYNQEIEEAIEQKHIEEAIAHCRHILKSFPKHVDTYRLLGKAYLESQRYGNASDIFQRVLSSIPNDFISHVGMSIIREDEGNLDAAIWHMERAFESQPYNTAIQRELRRLFGKRDGMEPPKVRMTRGALARMYAKSDLYDQAIAEIRSNLADDPQRSDLQVLLAQMYAKKGKDTEAIEVCSSLLQRLPYCLEANRLIAELLPDGERPDELKTYRQRIQELDPYETYVSSKHPTTQDVPNQTISLNRLDWDGSPVTAELYDQPEWATSIGVELEGSEKDDEGLPDWLIESSEESDQFENDIQDTQDDSQIPKWMQKAGWKPSSGEFDERSSSQHFDEMDEDVGEAEVGDIPGWLQEIAPEGILEDSTEEVSAEDTEAASDETLPDWLDTKPDGASDTIINWLDGKEELESLSELTLSGSPIETEEIQETIGPSDLPDWLQDLEEAEVEPEIEEDLIQAASVDEISGEKVEEADTSDEMAIDLETAEIPDWLQDISEAEVEPDIGSEVVQEVSQDEGIEPFVVEPTTTEEYVIETEPEIIQAFPLEEEKEAAAVEHEIPDETTVEAESVEIPDWLQDIGEQETIETFPSGVTGWLEEIDEGVIEKTEIEYQPDELPLWLQNLGGESQDIGVDIDLTQHVPPVVKPESGEDFASEVEPTDISEWLQNLSEITEEETVEEIDELPEWVQDYGDEMPYAELQTETPAGIDVSPSEISASDDEIASELEGEKPHFDEVEADLEFEDADASMAWLESLVAKQGVSEEELITKPEERLETPPEWVVQAEKSEPSEVYSEESTRIETSKFDVHGKITDTREPEEIQTVAEDLVATPQTEVEAQLPDWLADLAEDQEAEEITEVAEVFEVTTEPEAEAQLPDWLAGLAEDQEAEESTEVAEVFEVTTESEAEAQLPDWLADLAEDQEVEETPEFVEVLEVTPEPEAETLLPDWLAGLAEDQEGVEQPAVADELGITPVSEAEAQLPDWLADIAEAQETGEQPVVAEGLEITSEFGDMESSDQMDFETEVTSYPTNEDTKIPERAVPDLEFEDADAAMAWLESLAAKQGISEEELLTSPGEGLTEDLEIPKEKLDDSFERIQDKPEVGEQVAEMPGGLEMSPEPVIEFPDKDTPDWLQDAITPEDIQEVPVMELEDIKDELEPITDDIPDWVSEEIMTDASMDESESLVALSADDETVAMTQVEHPQVPDELTSEPASEFELEPPTWVMEGEEPEDENYQWIPAEDDLVSEAEPQELLDINNATMNQLERLTSLGFSSAQAIIAYRTSNGPFNNLEEITNVPGIDAEIIEILKLEARVIPPVESESETGMLEPTFEIEPDDEYHAQQLFARRDLDKGEYTLALEKYEVLVKKGKRLEEVIEDLNQALMGDLTNEVCVDILQSLGDAYFRADRLQDALDTYSQAEVLLR